MLCYLGYPGRPLRAGERPPAELTAFVAEQLMLSRRRGVLPPAPPNCRSGFGCAPLGNTPRRNSPTPFIRNACLRTTASSILPSWSWRNAAGGGSSFRRRGASNVSVSISAFVRGGRSSAG